MQKMWTTFRGRDVKAGERAHSLPLLSVSQTRGVIRRSELGDETGRADDLSIYKTCEPNNLVLNRMSAYQGAVGIASEQGLVSPDYLVMDIRPKHFPKYLMYLIKSHWFVGEMTRRLRGIGTVGTASVRTPRISEKELGDIELPVATIEQQRAIADFLDQETAEIDAFIADQERLIELLNERRTATITHAVTKGLDPSAPLRDSGIPWLGHIPTHWQLGKLKNITESLPGYAFPSSDFAESGVRLLRGINISPGSIRWDDVVSLERDADLNEVRFALSEGDIVLGLDRPVIGTGTRVAMVKSIDLPAYLVQRVLRVRATVDTSLRYLLHLLSSNTFADYLAPQFTGVSVPHLSESQVGDFQIGIPEETEQIQIAEYLDSKLEEFDLLIADAQRANELSKERRAALISAAVTGQIDARAHA